MNIYYSAACFTNAIYFVYLFSQISNTKLVQDILNGYKIAKMILINQFSPKYRLICISWVLIEVTYHIFKTHSFE